MNFKLKLLDYEYFYYIFMTISGIQLIQTLSSSKKSVLRYILRITSAYRPGFPLTSQDCPIGFTLIGNSPLHHALCFAIQPVNALPARVDDQYFHGTGLERPIYTQREQERYFCVKNFSIYFKDPHGT